MRYDVAVIGAGPAGSSAAEKLSSLGHKVLLIDPCDKKKVCAGILTARYVRRYGINQDFVERKLKGVRISFRDIRAEITYRKAVEYSIDRKAYDSFRFDQAVAAGSEFKKELVSSIEEKESSASIRTNKERISAEYAIIASGVSELSRICGGAKKYAFCVQQKRYAKPEDYFEMQLMQSGYSWVAPKKDYVMAGTSSSKGYPDVPGEKGLIPLEPVKKTYSGRFLLAGDAAGLVSPFEGEGIYYARRSGEIAAETLSSVLCCKTALDDYEARWKKEFDFSTLSLISEMLSKDRVLEAFVRELRDNERFNKVVEDILTKENKRIKVKDIPFLIKTWLHPR